ncbi:MAG TPA: YdiU family protein, partial [Bacillota bacterium]|nr:YdiU family protein [Bacillota bacterium]
TFYTCQAPSPVPSPKLIILNHPLAAALGLKPEVLENHANLDILAGNSIPEGASPLAQAYAGHQFGHFTMLGDGRAILLGEQLTSQGNRFDIQLKGSGQTPYSRGGDGRAALGPMLREYIISEGMRALGIPTTRSLAVVTTGETVYRQRAEPGAVLTRVAASHLRVGTFQYAAKWGSPEELKALADYALARHYPHCTADQSPYLCLLREVVRAQAALIAKWQLVGFIHGVMNTDNMTISGETIDYGPCAFMDAYDPETVFSSIDRHGRYAYGNQPHIGGWNLARFAETLLPLLDPDGEKAIQLAQDVLSDYSSFFHDSWLGGMRAKLGLFNEEQEDDSLAADLLSMMEKQGTDFTNTFLALTYNRHTEAILFATREFEQWQQRWQARLKRQPQNQAAAQQLMQSSNPAVIPRNQQVEAALAAAVQDEDFKVMERLLRDLSSPYSCFPEMDFSIIPQPPEFPYRTFCGT